MLANIYPSFLFADLDALLNSGIGCLPHPIATYTMAPGSRTLPVAAVFLTSLLSTTVAESGTGTTTRYWDCCKPSCAWNDLSTLGIDSAVKSCDVKDQPITDTSAASGCNGGTAYMCSSQVPWAVSETLAYGFAAVSASTPLCCQCYKLTFTSTSLSTAGKTMIVQATNTGSDVSSTQFDIAMPGGGFGAYDGCKTEWGATSALWGQQYGGSTTDTCSQFPSALQAGCKFRWDWFEGADNPTVSWETVACPAAITDVSGCVRTGDTPTGSSAVPTYSNSSATATLTSIASTATSTTTEASSCTIARFGQCGGSSWTGCTKCASGSRCKAASKYYSQCL